MICWIRDVQTPRWLRNTKRMHLSLRLIVCDIQVLHLSSWHVDASLSSWYGHDASEFVMSKWLVEFLMFRWPIEFVVFGCAFLPQKTWDRRNADAVHHTAPHCNTLQRTARHYNALQHTQKRNSHRCSCAATHCTTLQRTAPRCNALHHAAKHRNALQHTAPLCRILQHTATTIDSFWKPSWLNDTWAVCTEIAHASIWSLVGPLCHRFQSPRQRDKNLINATNISISMETRKWKLVYRTYCIKMQNTATQCNTGALALLSLMGRPNRPTRLRIPASMLQHTATHFKMHHTTPHCTTLHHTAPHCTTLHHTAPHCTIGVLALIPLKGRLHHTAIHCTSL